MLFSAAEKKAGGSNSLTDSSSHSGDAGGGSTADCWNPDPYPSVVSSRNVDNRVAGSVMAMAAENQERFASAKMLSSKAQAGTYNIGVRMAVMEELERALNLLDKIRSCIGEDKYREGVHDVYASLPKYGTFKKEVKVIDVDNDDDDPPPGAANKEASDSGNVDSDGDDSNDDDTDGGIDLEKMFPNIPGNDVEYVYTRNASGRVIAVDCCLKKRKKGTKDVL